LFGALSRFYPERYQAAGDAGVGNCILSGLKAARSLSIKAASEAALYVHLTFLLGSGFAADPQYTFIQAALTASAASGEDPYTRVHKKALEYFRATRSSSA
jgi:hypothetical protein